jgi:hypothetical protein
MKYGNGKCKLSIAILRLVSIMVLIAVCGAALAATKAQPPIVEKCKADLAKRFKVTAQDIKVTKVEPTTWPDASLGMPEPGKMYAQVLTPGYRIILEAKNTKYLYTASAKAFKYGGPVDLWSISLLYTKPVPDEPDLNEDLYQCSMLGTNSVRIGSGVEDYFPQSGGGILINRRTSRSSHDLVYIKAGSGSKEKLLYSSFNFGDAAMNGAVTEWAAYVRPSVGDDWQIVVCKVGGKYEDAKSFPLPDGTSPGQIAWSGENVQILTKDGEMLRAYEISPKAASPAWKPVPASDFPGMPDYNLNKSESLEISQMTEDGKTFVEVATVWFTGDRKPIARIPGMTLSSYDFLGGRYAFVTGEQNSKQVSYTVDITTDEVIPGIRGSVRNIKPFLYPLRSTPVVKSEK